MESILLYMAVFCVQLLDVPTFMLRKTPGSSAMATASSLVAMTPRKGCAGKAGASTRSGRARSAPVQGFWSSRLRPPES